MMDSRNMMDDVEFLIMLERMEIENKKKKEDEKNQPKVVDLNEEPRCYDIKGGKNWKEANDKLKAAYLKAIMEKYQKREEPVFRVDILGRKIYKDSEETRMRKLADAEADEHQINFKLSWTAREYGVGSDEFREIVNARARGDLVLRPPTPPADCVGPKPELTISAKLIKDLQDNYSESQFKKECEKAHKNYIKGLGLTEDDDLGENEASKFIARLCAPIKGVSFRKENETGPQKPVNIPKWDPSL